MVLIELRSAMPEDAKIVFKWRNDPFIFNCGFSRQAFEWEDHLRWFEESLNSPSRKIFIIVLDGRPAGQVRFDRSCEEACVISVYLMSEYTGKGYGVDVIKNGCKEIFKVWGVKRIDAYILSDNINSRLAFKRAGFTEICGSNCQAGHKQYSFSISTLIQHNRLTFGHKELKSIEDVVASGNWACGPMVKRLEEKLAQITERHYAICVGSGLAAIRLALLALDVKPGDNVILPAYSCVALANAVLSIGASPRLVDVLPKSWNINPEQISDALNKRTKAIIAIHTFGFPAAINDLMEYGLPVIEDCAHALGMKYNGRPLGKLGDISISSFYATKLVGCGEGGVVLADNKEFSDFILNWRDYNDKLPSSTRLNDKMTDLEAALASVQLDRLQSMIEKRRDIARRYDAILRPIAERTGAFEIPVISETRIWYRYAIEMYSIDVRDIIEEMRRNLVIAEIPVTDWRSYHPETVCNFANRAYRNLISLPIYPTLSSDEQETVCNAFISAVEKSNA